MSARTVGWVGTGAMGTPMVLHMMNNGCKAFVYSRTASKCQPLVEAGATLCSSPADVAKKADTVFVTVGLPEDTREAILGSGGVLEGAEKGTTVIDMGTSPPELSEEIAKAAGDKGCRSLDAPITGGVQQAVDGTLSIMVGGSATTFKKAQGVLELLSKSVRHFGANGAGQKAKLAEQVVVAAQMVGVCEGLVFAHKSGLNPNDFLAAVQEGSGISPSTQSLGNKMVARDFEGGCRASLFTNDLGLAVTECERMSLNLPGLKLAKDLYASVASKGVSTQGHQALLLALEEMNGTIVEC